MPTTKKPYENHYKSPYEKSGKKRSAHAVTPILSDDELDMLGRTYEAEPADLRKAVTFERWLLCRHAGTDEGRVRLDRVALYPHRSEYCTRIPPHDGPCNGLPCVYVASRMVHLEENSVA